MRAHRRGVFVMTAPTPLDAYLRRHPNTRYVDALLCDLSAVMRGKRYPIGAAAQIFQGGVNLPGSTCMLAVTGDSLDPKGLGFSDGDPDATGVPLPGTLAPSPWAGQPTAQVLLTLRNAGGAPYYYEPRNVLARTLARFEEQNLRPVAAFELEFYLVDPLHLRGRRLRPPRGPLSGTRDAATQVYSLARVEDFGEFLHAVAAACAQQGIACGPMSAEYAPGQFEINLSHGEPLRVADQCVLFRHAVQSVARRHNLCATFMAKPYPGRAGSGLHLHISLLNDKGENVFAGGGDRDGDNSGGGERDGDDSGDGDHGDGNHGRDGNHVDGKTGGDGDYGDGNRGRAPADHPTPAAPLLHAIGGMKSAQAESMAVFAPNRNSRARLKPDQYVPVRVNWGFDNRSVAMRVPKCKDRMGRDLRIEHRVAGADANPYLALAAALAGMHHGLQNQIDPGRPAHGDAGAQVAPGLPRDLESALDACRRGRILRAYFGAQYIDAYCACKLAEYRAFTKSGATDAAWYL